MKEILLSAAIIVKNAEETILHCISSLKGVVDEIVVVDTGSTDKTMELLQSENVTVYQHTWKEDFSEARNVSIDYVTGQWVLIIDADECIVRGADSIRDLLENTEAEAYWIEVENVLNEAGTEKNSQKNIRLFRNKKEYRYAGAIHEQIIAAIRDQSPLESIKDCDILIRHTGYLPKEMKKHDKINRNYAILKKDWSNPDATPFLRYNLAIEEMRLGNQVEAIHLLEKCIGEENPQSSYLSHAYFLLASIRWETKNIVEVEKVLQTALELYPDYGDLHYLRGKTFEYLSQSADALESFYKAIEIKEVDKKYISRNGTTTFLSHLEVGKIYYKKGYYREASQRFRLCIQQQPSLQEAYLLLADCLLELEFTNKELVDHFTRLTNNHVHLAETYIHVELLDEAESMFGELPSLQLSLVPYLQKVLLLKKKLSECLELTEKVLVDLETERIPREIAINYFIGHWQSKIPMRVEIAKQLQNDERFGWLFALSAIFTEGKASSMTITSQEEKELFHKFVTLRTFALGDTFVKAINHSQSTLRYAKLLYQEGYIQPAAELFIQLYEKKQMDEEALFYLGEIMYKRHKYSYAAVLFEEVLFRDEDHWRARNGAALCYLAEAFEWMAEGQEQCPQEEWIHYQMQQTNESIESLNNITWQTSWSAKQRRNTRV